MFDRQARRSRARLGWLALGAVVTATVAAVVAVHEAQTANCTGNLTLPITVAPSIDPIVQQTANNFNATRPSADGHCVQVQITVLAAAAEASEVPFAQVEPPALWIPDSTMWAQRATQQASTTGGSYAPKLRIHPAIASTPLVIGATESVAREYGWPTTEPGWQQVVAGPTQAVIGDPTTSTEGLAAVSLIESALGDPAKTPSPRMVATLLQLGRSTVSDVSGQFVDGGEPHVFTTTEQAVTAFNKQQQPAHPAFVAMYPPSGTILLDYPVVRVVARTEPDGTATAAADFEQALRSAGTAKLLADNGFRTPDGTAPAGAEPARPTILPPPSPATVNTVLRTWTEVNLDTRFLDVVDVSGAMAGIVPGGESLIDFVRDASKAVLPNFSDTSEIGLWAFADHLGPPNDWREVIPLGPLGQPMNGSTRRTALAAALDSLPGTVGGRADLYGTTLAAYQAMWNGYDPTKINALVLMTDGKSTMPGSPDLNTLLAQLKALQQPNKVVPILAIGIGPGSDLTALRQIAAVTGGQAYQVLTPADIGAVFVDAMFRRTCQAHC